MFTYFMPTKIFVGENAVRENGVDFSEAELTEWTATTISAKNVAVCPFDVTREGEIEIYKTCLI